jgi:hypothetical protein
MSRLLLIGVAVLAGCARSDPGANELARETAEHRELVAAMENHPSLADGQGNASSGKPLTFPRTVRPRPEGVAPAHHNEATPPAHHNEATPHQH